MGYLKRADILNCDDIKTEEVDVPEWGGTVVVKMMNGKERDAFESSFSKVKGKEILFDFENSRAKLVARTIIDPETKELMFTSADIETLGKKSSAALDRVYNVAQRLSKITDEDIEELEKNLETDLSDSSITL